MGSATLTIDLNALCANWQSLDRMTRCETSAVVKADAYGLGADRVACALARAGARTFFVAIAEEGAALRDALGPGPMINVFSGHMPGDADMISDMTLTPMINSIDQMIRHVEALPDVPFGLQLDSGMNRLGMEPAEWAAVRGMAMEQNPTLIMSHLACADEPEHAMNAAQLQVFRDMTQGIDAPRSLANTGGVLLGSDYHFDLTRPGIGIYGGMPFTEAHNVARLSVPVIQCRTVAEGETVGYGNTFTAQRETRIATISAGYADGFIRATGSGAKVFHEDAACALAGRVSMDLIGVDITDLGRDPDHLDILCEHQTIDDLAEHAGTVGYEILTSLGDRYTRRYIGA